jgi:hypothetical protein
MYTGGGGYTDESLAQHVELGLIDAGVFFKPTALEFRNLDTSSFSSFFLDSGMAFVYEDSIFRFDGLDILGALGFALFYDWGIIRWRTAFFYFRSMHLSLRWGAALQCSSNFFPNLSEFYLFFGHPTEKPRLKR